VNPARSALVIAWILLGVLVLVGCLIAAALVMHSSEITFECAGNQAFAVRVEHGERIAYALTGTPEECR
jgi:hypothetical protein